MKTARLCHLLALICLTFNLQAQTSQTFIPQIFTSSPNTASLGKFGDYPVSMFSGLPTISIPLYEIQTGDLKVPITLDYHASGNRVFDVSSWVGLGWSISAGGEITRKIEGKPDEGTSGYLTGTLRNQSTINTTNIDDLMYLQSMKDGQKDGQPDIFSYSFPGKGGKFFFDGTKTGYPMRLVPFSPIKISRTNMQLNGFSVLDEHGNSYQFSTLEMTDFLQNNASNPQISAWMLDKMVSQSGKDVVDFTYTRNQVMSGFGGVETVSVNDMSYNALSNPVYFNSEPITSVSTSNQYTQEQVPNTISFKNGKVVFVRSANNRQDLASKSLDNIQIYSLNSVTQQYTLLKTIKFYQSYFTDGTAPHPPRLRLDSIGFFDNAGVRVQRYAFLYNSRLLPDVNSKAQDYWGYYNGLDANNSLIPRMIIDYQTSNGGLSSRTIGSNLLNARDPDGDAMKASVLQRIVYPTGGYTDFQFEPNQYLQDGVQKLAGGLRVANIINYDGINPTPVVKSYQYSNARPNFAITDQNFVERLFSTTVTANYFATIGGAVGEVFQGSQRQRAFYSSANADINSWDNVIVAYNTVTEYTGDGVTNSGKTIYRFRDYPDAKAYASITGKYFSNSYFFYRGSLLEKAVYARNPDNTYRIVQKENMGYTAFPLTAYNDVGLAVSKKWVNQGINGGDALRTSPSDAYNDFNAFWFAGCVIFSDDNYLTGKTTTTYSPDTTKFIANTELYKYNNIVHQQRTKVYHRDSRGNTIVTRMKYPADFLPANGTTTGNLILDNMISRNMQAEVVEKWDSVKYVSPASSAITSAQLNTFKAGVLSAIVPARINKLKIANPVVSYDTAKVISGQLQGDTRYDPIPEVSFDVYDPFNNNLLQYTPHAGSPVSILWDYGKNFPIAEAKGSIINLVAYTSFESDGTGNWQFSGAPVIGGIPGGTKAYLLSSGTISYPGLVASKAYIVSYWSNGAAATVTGIGATAGTLLRTINGWNYYEHRLPAGTTGVSITGSVTIDELRLHPTDAQMTTYTYNPLVGVTSIIDPKGLATYYEYDPLQRLRNVKDLYGNIVKSNRYNNTPVSNINKPFVQYYYSRPQSPSIQKNDCGPNFTGSFVTYNLPDRKYMSKISQADADQQATSDVTANGQGYANSHGTCIVTYFNPVMDTVFHKNNCGVGLPGSAVTYPMPARTYRSIISQADANQQARNDINANGQKNANGIGSCPLGTDVANWQINYAIIDPQGHTVKITVSRPAGDINNENTVYYRIKVVSNPDLTGNFVMPSGVNTYSFNATFSTSLTGNITSISIDSIN